MKLWQKEHTDTDSLVERFTVGRDREFDHLLAAFDVEGSLAHTEMLSRAGLLTAGEKEQIHTGLRQILELIASGQFMIEPDVEDVHSQIELMLTRRIGDAGKKIHSGRSRNDQVALDIKLYLRQELQEVKALVVQLFDLLQALSETHRDKLLPGYTHLQVAMPSSFGLWFGAYAESLADDMELLAAAYRVTNRNPLGSGAGYGSSFPLDRELTTQLLGMDGLHYNVVYAQMSRGKTEKFVATGIAALAATLARFAMDTCLYMSQDLGFISFPDALTTGSSIMPHKKNPDIFELVRAKCNRLQALPNEFALMLANLPSGYHRDLQLTKEILFPGISTLKDCLDILIFSLPQIRIKTGLLQAAKYKYLFTVESVNDLVNQGMSFRDAYREVGRAVEAGTFVPPAFSIEKHRMEGAMGNLCTEQIRRRMQQVTAGIG